MPDAITPGELKMIQNPVINTSTLSTSTYATSATSGKTDLTQPPSNQYNNIIGSDSGSGLSQTQLLSSLTDTDYQFITAVLLLGIFILNLFDLLRRLGSKKGL